MGVMPSIVMERCRRRLRGPTFVVWIEAQICFEPYPRARPLSSDARGSSATFLSSGLDGVIATAASSNLLRMEALCLEPQPRAEHLSSRAQSPRDDQVFLVCQGVWCLPT